jgi:antitoxin component of RelBE/YafQ-DinJ toxin-antitoxin module
MTIQLSVTSELERQLRKVADQMGLTPDTYIMRLLQKDLQTRAAPARLSPEESKLLKQINASLSAIEWERYRILLEKRDNEILTASEQTELIALSDQIEEANARRMEAVAELARVRKTTVPSLVENLGLSSAHA